MGDNGWMKSKLMKNGAELVPPTFEMTQWNGLALIQRRSWRGKRYIELPRCKKAQTCDNKKTFDFQKKKQHILKKWQTKRKRRKNRRSEKRKIQEEKGKVQLQAASNPIPDTKRVLFLLLPLFLLLLVSHSIQAGGAVSISTFTYLTWPSSCMPRHSRLTAV